MSIPRLRPNRPPLSLSRPNLWLLDRTFRVRKTPLVLRMRACLRLVIIELGHLGATMHDRTSSMSIYSFGRPRWSWEVNEQGDAVNLLRC